MNYRVLEQQEQLQGLIDKVFKAVARVKYKAYDGEPADALVLRTSDDHYWILNHTQSCYEKVYIEDVCGDLADLVGANLLMAELVTREVESTDGERHSTWSFYKFATFKGYVTVRWFGQSNGYYSEMANHFEEYESFEALTDEFTFVEAMQ